MDVLAKRVADLKVDVRFDARAVALIVDAGNRVVGLVVRSEGRDQFVRALKGVILCAGGFIMNQTLVRQHAPHLARANTPIGTVDDGRSEEHTSELQSLMRISYAAFCLKKKTN